VRVLVSSVASESVSELERDDGVDYVPPRRRLSTGAHADFVGALVREFRLALASLQGASDLLVHRRHDLDDAVVADLGSVVDRQAARVAWLVRVLEAVDGDGATRRVETVHGPTVARQAAAACELRLDIAAGADRDGEAFPGDPERVRLGLEILFQAMASPAGAVGAGLAPGGALTVVAPALDLDEPQRRFALRAAFRVLDTENCPLRVRRLGGETRAEVRLGPRTRK
jgi:hypothetical protein